MKLKIKIISIISKFFKLGPNIIFNDIKNYDNITIQVKSKKIELLNEPNIVCINDSFQLHYNKEKIMDMCSDFYIANVKKCRYLNVDGLDLLSNKNIVFKFLTIVKGYTVFDGELFAKKVFSYLKYPAAKRIKGKSLFLTTMGAGHVYGEWVIFLLPKIGFMKEFGYKFEDFDNIVINSPDKNWQKDFIRLIGIPNEKIIPTNNNSSFTFDELVIPFGPGHSISGYQFLQTIPNLKYKKNKKRYFLSRDRDSYMRVLNQNDLNIILIKYNIETIFIQDYSIEDQIKIFKESELIISPQGSGLSNIVFSDSSTKFIELYAKSSINQTFQVYGYYNQNIYGVLLCENVPSEINGKFDLIINKEELEKIIINTLSKNY